MKDLLRGVFNFRSEEKPSKSDVSDVDEEKDTKEKPTAEKLAGDEEKKQRTKLLVRNVPFQVKYYGIIPYHC